MAATSFATAADLNVPADYPTIQAAVNTANTNDTIYIAPGVYTGQVFITNKTLTLIGQPGTILRATTNMSPFFESFPPFVVPIMGVRSSQVTVRGLTFEGERLAEHFVGFADLEGIFFRNSGAMVENCTFYGLRESTPGPGRERIKYLPAISNGGVFGYSGAFANCEPSLFCDALA